MTRTLIFVLLTVLIAFTALGTEKTPTTTSDRSAAPTFNKDVLPLLQENCQTCHRPGGIGPMSLMTYQNVRPWAKAIKSAVVNKQMPPWFGDSHDGEFRNAPKLTSADVATLVAWVDSGAAEGNASDKPSPAPQWSEGWRIQPDVVVEMPVEYRVPATGLGEVRQFVIASPFKEDTWVTAIEIRPGDRSVVHHAIVKVAEARMAVRAINVIAPGSPAVAMTGEAVVKAVFERDVTVAAAAGFNDVLRVQKGQVGGSYSDILARLEEGRTGRGAFMTMEAVYAPGTQPMDFRYNNSAKLIPGGKPLLLEVHYTPNGKETTDTTSVGFTLAKAPADRQFVMMAPEHLVDIRKPIPAGDANYETVGELTFNQDADLAWFMPHMHLRGKDMTFRLVFPDGREQTVLRAGFNFHWQLGYELARPVNVTKGTRMIVTAHHDNSANNPDNPTLGKAVGWGEMTTEEMMLPWFGVIVDQKATPEAIATYKPGDMDGPFPMANAPAFLLNKDGLFEKHGK
jgi:hypothetical protein